MKKKFFSSLMLCLMAMWQAQASDVLTVEAVTIPHGSEAILKVDCAFESQFKAYQFDIELPDGLSLVVNSSGKPVCELGFEGTDHTVSSSVVTTGKYRFVCTSNNNTLLPMSGTLMKVKVIGNGAVAVGDIFEGKVTNTEFTAVNYDVTTFNNVTFTVTIGVPADTRTLLDETSTTVPAATANVNVRVKRSIKANEWSTLVLPFDMTEAQVKAAFGDDVQLAEYIEHEMNDEATQITITFDNALLAQDGLMANNPYIIKTSKDITEFTVDGVTIDPDEEGAIAEFTNGRTGSRKEVYGTFKGTYHAQTVVPNNCLFLSDNQFWYSKGQTKMKAFRAYFDLVDVLASVENTKALIAIKFKEGETTGIGDVNDDANDNDNRYYDLQGRRVVKPGKGLYIRNGKKVTVK